MDILRQKKPPDWLMIMGLVVVGVVVIALVANPKEKERLPKDLSEDIFAIYMIVVPKEGVYSVDAKDIDKLTLEGKPVLTDKDLVAYHVGVEGDTDIIEIKDDISLRDRLKENGHMNVEAVISPYVVVCNNERIYVGVISSSLSSYSFPQYADVYFDFMTQDQNIYEISALSNESVRLLRDQRIVHALDSLHLLKEYPGSDETNGDDSSINGIDMIIEKINERQIVGEEYIDELSENTQLKDRLEEYNEYTATLYEFFLKQAKGTMLGVFNLESEEDVGKINIPISFTELTERIAHHSLYENCTELFLDDPVLYPIIDKEAGGSAGQWPYWWHTIYLEQTPNVKEVLVEYFNLEKDLVEQLDAYKKSLD